MERVLIGFVMGVCATIFVQKIIAFFNIFIPWQRAYLSGAPVSMVSIIGMRLRGSPVSFIVDAHCTLTQANKPTTVGKIEACYIANRHKLVRDDMTEFLALLDSHPSTESRKEVSDA